MLKEFLLSVSLDFFVLYNRPLKSHDFARQKFHDEQSQAERIQFSIISFLVCFGDFDSEYIKIHIFELRKK